MTETPSPRPPLAPLVILVSLVIAGAVLRVFAALTDFWLDEILTLEWARGFGYWELVADPLTRHDNNHVLNSMWLRFVESFGVPHHWLPYRLLAIVTGTVASAAMGYIGWRRSPIEGVIAAGFGSLSFVMIHYSSECRGYAPVCCFALLAFIAVDRALRRPGWGPSVALAGCTVLGVLSHSTYAFAYIGFGIWSLVAWQRAAPGATIPWLVRLHAVPFAFLALIYFLRIRGMVIGGGPEFGVPRALTNTMAHVVGWAWTADWRGYSAAAVAVVMTAGGVVLRIKERRVDDSSWAFFVTIVSVTPLLTAFVLQPQIIFMRYFLVAVPFVMLLVSGLLAHVWSCCRSGRIATVVLLVVITGLNAWRLEGLLTAGRGQYLEALRFIVAQQPEGEIRVTGLPELHVDRLVGFYNRYLERPITFVKRKDARRPDWIIHETQLPLPELPAGQKHSISSYGTFYDRRAVYPYASMSGAHWYLMQRSR